MEDAIQPMLDNAARILVINVARIGDTLLIAPTLRALKNATPAGRLTVLAHPRRYELLQGLQFIDELGSITPKTAWYRGRLGARRWDVALVYGYDAPLIRYAARVAQRVVAFQQRDATLNKLLWKTVAPPPVAQLHAVHERLLLAHALGIETQDYRLEYAPAASELAAAQRWLAQHGATQHPLVGIQVASFQTKSYRDWPLSSFTELGRRLFARHPEARIVVFGGKESREHAQTLTRALGPRVITAAGAFRLRETAALMAQLDLYVGVDTGPTHLAGALRVPMVAMYHCRHPAHHLAPLQHNRLRAIEHPAANIDSSAARLMSEITVDEVWSAVESLLGPVKL